MRIMVDQEAIQVLRQICDTALRGAGLGILEQVNRLSACVQPFPQPKAEDEQPEKAEEDQEEATAEPEKNEKSTEEEVTNG